MEKGYITLPRSFFHSEEWLHPRMFSKAEAWLDILASVRFSSQPTTVTIAGKTVVWQKDCWPISQRALARRWQWTTRGVRSFLTLLSERGIISLQTREGITIIQVTDKERGRNTDDASETGSVTPHATPCVTPHATPHVTPHATPCATPRPASSATSPPSGATAFATPGESPRVTPSVTKQNKGKEERININDPTADVRVRDEVFELSLSSLWREAVCMRHHITQQQLDKYLDTFALDCIASGRLSHDTISEAKFHFVYWLKKQLLPQPSSTNHSNLTVYANHTKPTSASIIQDAQQWCLEKTEEILQKATLRHGEVPRTLPF